MKALVFQDKLTLVNDAPDPENPAEALVQVLYAGICNTDIEISKGYAGFQGILGHEFVGRVVSSEPGLHQKRVVGEINVGCGTCDLCVAGDQRHCSERTVLGIKGREGSFAEFLQLPVCNLLEVPESVGDETAVFTEPLAAACRITEQLPEGMQSVLVVGDGKLGQLIARVLALKASRVAIVGKHQSKLRMAELACGAVGFDVIGGRAEVRKQVLDWNSGRRVDVVVEATGSTAGLETAVQLVRPRGVLVLKTTHHEMLMLNTAEVVVNEISILGSRCGRFEPALKLLVDRQILVEDLITDVLPLDKGIEAFAKASSSGALKVLLRMNAA